MKYCFLVLIGFFLFFDISFAQPKYDYNWLFGYQGGLGNPNFGQSKISFGNGQIETTTTISDLYIGESNATMSDTDGNLAFYTNGCAIYNSEHQVMENGDGINPGDVHDDYCDVIGYPNGKQACLALPLPGSSGHYILFHQPSEIISVPPFDFDIICPLLYYSIIDMDQADGLGEVVDKNHIIVEDSLHTGHITAVKHSNGRDWWVLVPERQSARYHTLIVTPTGVVDTFSQEVGIPFLYEGEGSGQACFSPAGLKYLRYTYSDGLHLFDFDRQTGMLSNFFHIPGHPGTWSYGGAAFSPNGRFLYTIDLSWYIYQYDLESPDIAASQTLVGEYDGFLINNFWSTEFGDMQLGPDCRIYIATPGSNKYLHVINQPDKPGLECDFIQRAVKLPTWYSGTIPPFPNYRLDSIATYPCDSNIVLIPHDPTWVWERPAATERLRAWPNPSAGDFNLSLPQTAGRLVIFDPLGREIWRRELGGHEKEIVVEAAGWAPGLYHCAFAGEDGRVFAVVVLVQLL